MQSKRTTKYLQRLRRNRRAKREDAKVAKISPRKPLRTLAFFASSRFGWLKRMHSESSSRELLITEESDQGRSALALLGKSRCSGQCLALRAFLVIVE